MNAVTFSLIRPQRFGFSIFIVADNGICCIQNILCRAIVLLKLYNLCLRIDCFKIQNIADIGTTEFVNGLIIITDHTQISATACQ